jgi:hypothetical protein
MMLWQRVCRRADPSGLRPSFVAKATNVLAYVPKGRWSNAGATGIGVLNIGGTSITNTLVSTPHVVNSCAANPLTGITVCTADNTDVYLISGTTLTKTLTSGGSGTIFFSGGSCTNCGVAMDAPDNKAVIGLSIGSAGGFQFLDLATSTFEPAFKSPSGLISEDPLIDPSRHLMLSASERGNYEIVNVTTTTSPTFFEKPTGLFTPDSSGEDCVTGIALAPGEFSNPSKVFLANLNAVTFTAGSPGKWTAPSTIQTLTESSLAAGASGIAVAQGTHIGIVTGEFGGNTITAIKLPATSGSGTPAITDWVTCGIGAGFSNGFDPHTVTAYQSPKSSHAIAVLANGSATQVAVVDLTGMLDPTVVKRTAGGHGCATTGNVLPATIATLLPVP